MLKRNADCLLVIFIACLVMSGLPISVKASSGETWTTHNQDQTDSFYGSNALNSLVVGAKLIVPLPSGMQVELADKQTTYVLTDHQQSTLVAVDEDNEVTRAITYTPFGDSQATGSIGMTKHYTGQALEPETATYDYHARRYDPSTLRFTSLDAIRQSISPYSYTANNPINFIDPNGLGSLSVLFYESKFANKEFMQQMENMTRTFSALGLQHVAIDWTTVLSDRFHKKLLTLGTIENIIFNVNPEIITQVQPGGIKKLMARPPATIAAGIIQELLAQNPDQPGPELNRVKSIFLQGCGLACGPEKTVSPKSDPFDGSWAAEFAIEAKKRFPKLEHVLASPYNLTAEINPKNLEVTHIFISETAEESRRYQLRFDVPTRQYHEGGDSLLGFVNPPETGTLIIRKPVGGHMDISGESVSPVTIREHIFNEPILYKLPLIRGKKVRINLIPQVFGAQK